MLAGTLTRNRGYGFVTVVTRLFRPDQRRRAIRPVSSRSNEFVLARSSNRGDNLQGSEFRLEANEGELAPGELRPFHVLVVEDDPSSRELLERRITAAGYAVATASRGSECRAYFQSHTPDAVLLDICLPDATGLDLLKEIRSKWSRQAMPVLLVTALGEDDDILAGIEAGANDYVVKPINASILLARLEVNLNLKAAVTNLEQTVARRTRELIDTNADLEVEITARRRKEEELKQKQEQLIQSEKMRSLGVLASGIAHEVNNPNHVILSSADTLLQLIEHVNTEGGQQGGANTGLDTARELLHAIGRNGHRIAKIVQELKDYSKKSESNQLTEIRLNDVVNSSVTLLKKHIQSSTRNFRLELSDQDPVVLGNYVRLEQVIINLIQNACHALTSPDREIRLTTNHLAERSFVEVEDAGEGIADEDLARLTDPFFTTRRGQGGTGLGLSICDAIVREHQGALEFWSELGKGTRVRVTLPSHPVPETASGDRDHV